MPRTISFRKGYKYQLAKGYSVVIEMSVSAFISTEYIDLRPGDNPKLGRALLTIRRGYAWDGPSGPTIDTCTFMRGSLVHDALYQLLRQGHLPPERRLEADMALKQICLQDGMSRIRAWYVYRSVRRMAFSAADPKNVKRVCNAP